MDRAVVAAGGQRVRDSVGVNPPFYNADYVFVKDNVIAEMKNLEKNFLSDPAVADKMHHLYNRWIDEGKDVPIMFGESILRTDQLPVECARQLIEIFKDRLESSVLRKANRQIRETKKELNYPDAVGLLMLSNEGNFAFDPEMTAHVLFHSLRSKFSSIEHVILLSGNLEVGGSAATPSASPFISIRFPNRRQPTDDFLHRLGSTWYEALSIATGKVFPPFGLSAATPTEISQLRFR